MSEVIEITRFDLTILCGAFAFVLAGVVIAHQRIDRIMSGGKDR